MTRRNYWSTSEFARWVTKLLGGKAKPNAATWEGWATWKQEAKTQAPFSFWFTETFLTKAQNFVNYPKDKWLDLRHYLYNRFVSKTHFCKTGLPAGKYTDTGQRIFNGVFTELVNFIEIEKAGMLGMWNTEAATQYSMPWTKKRFPSLFWWSEWRSAEAGIEYLKWEMSLVQDFEWLPESERKNNPDYGKPTPQAIAAKEQYELYIWWTEIRPARKDPYELSGWSTFCKDSHLSIRTDPQASTPDWQTKADAAHQKLIDIENQYDTEDVEMAIRLIKIYDTLWT